MEFITTNGQKKVTINTATFKEMCDLRKEAMKCIQCFTKENLLDLKAINTSQRMDAILDVLIEADTSDSFNNALFKCLGRCTYDEFHSITPQFFEDNHEAIEDYYEIVAKCIEVNMRPFYKSLVSAFKANMAHLEKLDIQKQK